MMPLQKRFDVDRWEVTFQRRATTDETVVAIVGDFNGWSTHINLMTAVGDTWSLVLLLAPGRRYRFRYLIDHTRWENDWEADDYVDNSYGGQDSVVDLTIVAPAV
jgi:1,4-alpha-glucan branching enzyme